MSKCTFEEGKSDFTLGYIKCLMYPSSSTIWIQPPSFSFRRGSKWNQAATETICLLGQMVFWIPTCWLSSKAVSFSSCPRQSINKCVIFKTSFYPFSGQSTWETACHGCITDFQSSAYFWGCWGDGPLQKWDVHPHTRRRAHCYQTHSAHLSGGDSRFLLSL